MNTAADATLLSWGFPLEIALPLAASAVLYLRGWLRLRTLVPHRFPVWRAIAFLSGLTTVFVALASPLDSFASLLLSVHMIQHLLLTMVAPPLILFGSPFLPILRGLPRSIAADGLGPFLTWPPLKTLGGFLIHPIFAWSAFVISNVVWHLPMFYDLALRSEVWHRVEHVSFLTTAILFWWPIIQPWPSRPVWPRWAMIPYLLLADLQNTALGGFISFYDRVLYQTYAMAPQLAGIQPLEDQQLAGALMWVPGSIAFLVPAGVIAIQFLSPKRPTPAPTRPVARPNRSRISLPRIPLIAVRRSIQWILLGLAALVVWDGLTGPQVSAMNSAGVLPWTHWRGLVVIALLLAGNLFCMGCPFMLVRDGARKLFRPFAKWPRALRNKWPAVGLVIVYLWAYEVFALWDWPWMTAWLVIAYFVAAAVVDCIFKGASFCKWVCPIGQFHFVQSLASPAEIRIKSPDPCRTCRTYDCIKGNATQRGCELELFQPRKSGNMDCTFCLDCVSACPHDNVALLPTPPAKSLWSDGPRSSVGRFENRLDLAALIAVFTFGAFANAAGMLAPFQRFEEWLQSALGFELRWPIVTVFLLLSLVVLPAILLPATAWISQKIGGGAGEIRTLVARFTPTLAPLGLGMWAAHFIFHLFTASHTPIPVLQRLAGVENPAWDTPSLAWDGLLGVELLLLDLGLLVTLFSIWKISKWPGNTPTRPLFKFLPWAVLAALLYACGVWIVFQPMEMRGTLLP